MSSTRTGSINRRFLLGAVSLGWLASASRSFSASPNPFFVSPKLLVFDYAPQDPTDPQLRELLFTDQVGPELLRYTEEELARLGINLPIIPGRQFAGPTADTPEGAILYVSLRIDIARASLGGDAVVIGAVSLRLNRHDESSWSVVPYELFAVPPRADLVRSTMIASAKLHLTKSLIEPIARLHQQ